MAFDLRRVAFTSSYSVMSEILQ